MRKVERKMSLNTKHGISSARLVSYNTTKLQYDSIRTYIPFDDIKYWKKAYFRNVTDGRTDRQTDGWMDKCMDEAAQQGVESAT